jgi:hypothetical protein
LTARCNFAQLYSGSRVSLCVVVLMTAWGGNMPATVQLLGISDAPQQQRDPVRAPACLFVQMYALCITTPHRMVLPCCVLPYQPQGLFCWECVCVLAPACWSDHPHTAWTNGVALLCTTVGVRLAVGQASTHVQWFYARSDTIARRSALAYGVTALRCCKLCSAALLGLFPT